MYKRQGILFIQLTCLTVLTYNLFPLKRAKLLLSGNVNASGNPSQPLLHTISDNLYQSYSDDAVPFVATVATDLRDRASHRRTVLSPDAVTRRSGFEGCQQSWSTLSVWPRKVLSFDCNQKCNKCYDDIFAYSEKTNCILPVYDLIFAFSALICLQCFDAVGWAAGRASGL